MIRVGILGAKGYTAGELMRLLAFHPEARVECLMARVDAPEPVEQYFPFLRSVVKLPIEPIDSRPLPPVATSCPWRCRTPPPRLTEGSARLRPARHRPFGRFPLRFDRPVRGDLRARTRRPTSTPDPVRLPELFRSELTGPAGDRESGCYTTASILALAPLMRARRPGAGPHRDQRHVGRDRGRSQAVRHDPLPRVQRIGRGLRRRQAPASAEIEEKLSKVAGWPVALTFTPHLIPINRGILATCTIPMRRPVTATERMAGSSRPTATSRSYGCWRRSVPSTAATCMTNFVDIGMVADARSETLIVISSIDNLTKGASGQAVQNMNIMYGLPETMGLIKC